MSLSFLAPQFLWALLALPIIVLLHFIRARKTRRTVSALFLWKEAKRLAEQRRRFSPSWLLLLQLLFAGLAALALAQPRMSLAGPPDRVVIVDASASMAARDSDGLRLEKAKREAGALIRGAGRVAVVRAGLAATLIQPITDDLDAAERALSSLTAGDREADLSGAVSLALAILPEAEIYVLSDAESPSGDRVAGVNVGGDALNLGITTFDIGLQQAFVSVASSHPRPQEAVLGLYQDAQLVAQTTLLVPAQGRANASFPLPEQSGFFEARLEAPDWDALHLDDRAYAGKRALRVAVSEESEPVSRALAAIPDLEVLVSPFAAANAPGFDARILFGPLPEPLPPGELLLIAAPAPAPDYQFVRDWDRSDPLLRFVPLGGAVVGLDPDGPAWEEDGWRVLARSGDLRPVLLVREDQGRRLVILNVHPSQTDLVNRVAFPLLMANIISSFRAEERLPLGAPLPPGSALETPTGRQAATQALEPGLYEIEGNRVAVSLLSASETQLPSAPAAPAAPPAAAAEASEQVRGVALWLVLLALLALVAEWLLFTGGWRRPRWPATRLGR